MKLHSSISSLYMLSISIRLVMIHQATTLFYNVSIIQDIKQKQYSHKCVSPEPILFMIFNMKSKTIAFPQHTNYGAIRISNVSYQVVNEGTYIGLLSVLFKLTFPSGSSA